MKKKQRKESEVITDIFKTGTLLQVADRCGFTGSYDHNQSSFIIVPGDCFTVLDIKSMKESYVTLKILFDGQIGTIVVSIPKSKRSICGFFKVIEQQD